MELVRSVFELLGPVLDERTSRLFAAAFAEALGHGGVARVTEATGIRHKRIVAASATCRRSAAGMTGHC